MRALRSEVLAQYNGMGREGGCRRGGGFEVWDLMEYSGPAQTEIPLDFPMIFNAPHQSSSGKCAKKLICGSIGSCEMAKGGAKDFLVNCMWIQGGKGEMI